MLHYFCFKAKMVLLNKKIIEFAKFILCTLLLFYINKVLLKLKKYLTFNID